MRQDSTRAHNVGDAQYDTTRQRTSTHLFRRCITAQLPKSMGGAEGKAAYIDTEGTFRPDVLTFNLNGNLPSTILT